MKTQILQAAFKLFADHGYETSLSEIANQVGLRKASLYSHFQSKDELLKTVIEIEIDKRYAQETYIYEQYLDKSCEEKLKAFYFSTIEYYGDMEMVNFWRQLRNVSKDSLREFSAEKIKLKEERFNEHVKNVIDEGYLKGELNYPDRVGLCNLYNILVYGVVYFIRSYNSPEEFNALATSIWETFWNMAKASKEGSLGS